MSKYIVKFVVLFSLSFLLVGEVAAQLITDSDKRLKTQKAKAQPSTGGPSQPSKSPFSAFRKKEMIERRSINGLKLFFADKSAVSPKSASTIKPIKSFFPERRTARYSTGSPFKNQNYAYVSPRSTRGTNPFADHRFVSPKYSVGNIWSSKDKAKYPRYSAGSPFKKQNYAYVAPRSTRGKNPFEDRRFVSPKYSVGNVWTEKDKAKYPRYSAGSPFKNQNYAYVSPRSTRGTNPFADRRFVSPKYSVGNVWSDKDLYKSPRYSVGNVWANKDLNKSPRYSVGNVWSDKDLYKSPRYSVGNVWANKDLNKSPRYSVDMDWSSRKVAQTPKYSVGDPYAGYKFLNVPPKYSTNKDRFVIDRRYDKENTVLELDAGSYLGDFKFNWKKTKNMHPSFNHHQADQSIKLVRESMRKWNIFWVRLNPNEEDSKGVKKKVSKPKFDKKEAEIWNE